MTDIDANWNNAKSDLVTAAHRAGVDPGLVVEIAGLESYYSATARPISVKHPETNTITQFDGVKATTTAYGYGQFLDKTWVSTVQQ